MPVMDGINSTYQMRKFLSEVMELNRVDQPIIIGVTGHVQEKFTNEGLKSGMDEVLPKPLYKDVIEDMMDKYYNNL